jgi:hypothetical protein
MENKPGIDRRVDDKMEILLEQKMALDEAIAHYAKKIALNDWRKEWYQNASESYQRKLDKVEVEIIHVTGHKIEAAKEVAGPKKS